MYADRRRQLREKRLHPGAVLILASHCTGLKHPRTNADLSYPPDAVRADVADLAKCFAKRGFAVKIPRHADGTVASDFSREVSFPFECASKSDHESVRCELSHSGSLP